MGPTIDLGAWRALPSRARPVWRGARPSRRSAPGIRRGCIAIAERHGVPALEIGRVTQEARLRIVAGDRTIDSLLSRLATLYYDSIASIMRRGPAETAVAEQHPSIATV